MVRAEDHSNVLSRGNPARNPANGSWRILQAGSIHRADK